MCPPVDENAYRQRLEEVVYSSKGERMIFPHV